MRRWHCAKDCGRSDSRPTFAYDAADAIVRSVVTPYAAIVIDFELPDGGGIGLIRQLRERPETYKTPIVIVSADRGADHDAGLNVLKRVAKPADPHEVLEILDGIVARGARGRPRILHVDDDRQVLELVACALKPTACVVSANSIEQARDALLTNEFDLVVLDITLGAVCGLDLLPDLRSGSGAPIPVIVFSAHPAELAPNPQVKASLNKSGASLDDLIDAVQDRLRLRSSQTRQEVA